MVIGWSMIIVGSIFIAIGVAALLGIAMDPPHEVMVVRRLIASLVAAGMPKDEARHLVDLWIDARANNP